MKRIPAWLAYLFLRLVFLIVPIAILYFVLRLGMVWSVVLGVVIAFALSVILLNKLRMRAIEEMKARRERASQPSVDEAHEDSL